MIKDSRYHILHPMIHAVSNTDFNDFVSCEFSDVHISNVLAGNVFIN